MSDLTLKKLRLSVVAVVWLFCGTNPLDAANLLKNGDFEQAHSARQRRPEGWTFAVWSKRPSTGALEWSTEAHSGKRAAKLVGTQNAGKENARSVLYPPPVHVSAGLYKLQGWYKTAGEARAHLKIPMYSQPFATKGFGTPASGNIYRNLPAAKAWTPFSFDVDVKLGVRQLMVVLRVTGLGAVFYDDVSLKPVRDPLTVRLYPAEYGRRNTVPMVRDTPSFMRLMLIGDKAETRGPVEVVLDMPEGTGEFGLLGGGTTVIRGDQPYRQFRLPVDERTLRYLRTSISHCSITVWFDASRMPDKGAMFYRGVVNGKEMEEKQAAIRVLPPLPAGPLPQRFHSLFVWRLFSDVPEPLRPAVYDMIRKMGVDHHLAQEDPAGWRKYLAEKVRADGGKRWANIPHQYHKIASKKGWETQLIAKGKSFFEIDGGYYRRMAPHVDGVFWDWEPGNAMRNPLWDHPETVDAFAKQGGLNAEELNADRLQGELRDKFLAFRTWQLGQVVRLWAEYIHDLRPDLPIAICQGSGMPPSRNVDCRAYDDIPSLVHLPMIYTGSPMAFARNVAGLRDYLPKAKLFPTVSSSMVADKGWPAALTPRTIYLQFVSTALLGCVGCAHWPDLDRGCDMEYVWEISRALQDIAKVEPFLFDGRRDPKAVSVEPLPESEALVKLGEGKEIRIASPQWNKHALCRSYQLERSTLVAVCNMHGDKLAAVQVRAADAGEDRWSVYDPVTNAALVPEEGKTWQGGKLAEGILYEVPASSLGMLVIAPSAPQSGFRGEVREAEIRSRFDSRRRKASASGSAGPLRSGGLETSWADMDGDGNAEIRLASPHQELGLGASGNLWSWKVRGLPEDLVSRFNGGGACVDQFWWPQEARSSTDKQGDYELAKREIKDGRATVVMRRALAHWSLGGLIIEKAYSIETESPKFEVRVTIRNESRKSTKSATGHTTASESARRPR